MPLVDPLVSLVIALFGLSVAPNSKTIRYTCGLTLIAYQTYVIFRLNPPTTSGHDIWTAALASSFNVIAYFDHAIVNNAWVVHKRKGQTLLFTQMPFLQRLKWSTDLMLTKRGVNWSWEIPHLRRPTQSRWVFVRNQFFRVLVWALVSDILKFLRSVNPAWQVDNDEWFARGFMWQTYNVIIFWLSVASLQLCGYSLMSMVTVALGVYEPGDWPSFYGRFGDAKSVRMFWGRTWHQLLRRPFQVHGRFIATDILGLNPKSSLYSYIELYIAFFLSGICHAVADLAVSKVFRDGWTTVVYYVLQAVIITGEDGLIAVGKAIGIRRVPSVVGYAWVIFWMGLLGPIWIESMAQRGIDWEALISILSPSQIRALI